MPEFPSWVEDVCTFVGALCLAFWATFLAGCGVANLHKRTFGRRKARSDVVAEAEAITKAHAR